MLLGWRLARPPRPPLPPIRVLKRVAKLKAVSVDTEKSKKDKNKLVHDDVGPAPQAEVPTAAEERAASMQESAAATTVEKYISMTSTTPCRCTGFDLTDFMSSFNPALGSEAKSASPLCGEPPVATPSPRAQDELCLLRQELEVLRGEVAGVRQSLGFLEQAKKAKGAYTPPQTHMMAATQMFKGLSPREVLMALFSGRLGYRGLTILHFREEDDQAALEARSSNVKLSYGFSLSAAIPVVPPRCQSYEDILDGIHGLTRVGEAMWHNHMLLLTERLRSLVSVLILKDCQAA
ncbi:hypothetical protein PHMEG_00023788 [Phytophthora megakarya]|uniref:Uncharacterized protein n=1 Tax=Phytophthora megakarya TaxID=4795 RepID=A0A225VHR9_9STRA|nr:hypothetical protein PHMEG_00023788 [Phytophthora megakarya]